MTVNQALNKLGKPAVNSIVKELLQMHQRKVWTGVRMKDLTYKQKKRIISSSMFLKDKYLPDGSFEKLKARLVAGGHLQDKEIYDNGASPTASTTSIFMIAAIAAKEKRKIATVDFPGAFLNADMPTDGDKQVFMRLDSYLTKVLIKLDNKYQDCINEDGTITVKLNKALYGCIESARLWYENLKKSLNNLGFTANPYDMCIFNKYTDDGKQITICIHVDDMLITSPDDYEITKLVTDLEKTYGELTIKKGNVINYLGMMFDFTNSNKVKITMDKYVDDLLSSCDGRADGISKTPSTAELFNLDKDSKMLDKEDKEWFHSYTAKLLYLGKRIRPDILTTCSFLAGRVNQPTQQDLNKLYRLIRYVRCTKSMGIILESILQVIVHVDASYGTDIDYKSRTGFTISIGKGSIFAKSSRQKLMTKSSTEAELVGVSDAIGQIIWTRNFLIAQGYNIAPATVLEDNMSTIALIKNGKSNSERTRHIAIRFFFVTDKINEKEIKIEYVSTFDQIADILTKPLQGEAFIKLRNMLLNWY
jgi:hypothetical protein